GKFDDATAAVWKKAGAEVGWMGVSGKFGYQEFRMQPDGLAGAVPAFRFAKWRENILAGLPDPAMPFGLYLDFASVTDAGLRELAGLRSLQSLSLRFTKVTDAGLKELAGLNTLQWLNLGDTHVRGTGLKELAGLKSLQVLYLHGTLVTDAGLKELAG